MDIYSAAQLNKSGVGQGAYPFSGIDLEQLDYMASMYGAGLQRESAREANVTNIRLARENREWNAQQAQKQMDFQREMSNTAHQREMADLVKAGLNPILTATGGQGASSPAGHSASATAAMVNPELKDNPLTGLSQSALSARRFKDIELKMAEENLKLTKSNIMSVLENIDTQKSTQYMNSANALKAFEEAKTQGVMQAYYEAQASKLAEEEKGKVYENVEAEKKANMYNSPVGDVLPWIQFVLQGLGNVGKFIVPIKP